MDIDFFFFKLLVVLLFGQLLLFLLHINHAVTFDVEGVEAVQHPKHSNLAQILSQKNEDAIDPCPQSDVIVVLVNKTVHRDVVNCTLWPQKRKQSAAKKRNGCSDPQDKAGVGCPEK